jgi:phosphoglycerate dehydrogenase-like enzyme
MAALMAEYALFAVLALHRDMLNYRENQRAQLRQPLPLVRAPQRRIGVMGGAISVEPRWIDFDHWVSISVAGIVH